MAIGQTYGTLPEITKDNYTFDGWYDAISGGNKIEATTTVSKTTDHNLYAHWTKDDYEDYMMKKGNNIEYASIFDWIYGWLTESDYETIAEIHFCHKSDSEYQSVKDSLKGGHDLTVNQTGKVLGYNDAGFTKLYIVVEDGKKIYANEYSGHMFDGFSCLTEITGLDLFDTSKTKDMNSMFASCRYLTTLDLSGFDTSNVIDMNSMFMSCASLETLILSDFDTSNVKTMRQMFISCESLETLDLSSFNTSKVTDMKNMFSQCYALETLTINTNKFNTSSVTDMSGMFYHCENLGSVDVSGFDTSNVSDMNQMFSDCHNLISLDLSSFNTSKAEDIHYMFRNCSKIEALDLSNFNTSNVTDMFGLFNGCSKIGTLDLSNFNTSNVTDMDIMFDGCSSLSSLNLSSFDININDDDREEIKTSNMFRNCGHYSPSPATTITVDSTMIGDGTWGWSSIPSLTDNYTYDTTTSTYTHNS